MRRSFRARELHGLTRGQRRPPEYSAWHQMISRCNNPRHARFPDYGARGIGVCERWLSFVAFIADMGSRPSPEHTVERIDNDGDYEPANCRWAHRSEQARNRRNCQLLTLHGRTQNRSAWAVELGIGENTIKRRLELGWPVEKALTTPVNGAPPNITKGRSLTLDKARAIRARAFAGESDATLAHAFNVSPKTIGKIRRGKIWTNGKVEVN